MKQKLSSLFNKKYTFIFVPDVTGKFIRLSIRSAFVYAFVTLAIGAGGILSYFSYSILQKSAQLSELTELRATSAEHKTVIERFRKKVKQVEVQLARLEKFDRKLRVITALEPQTDGLNSVGAGGPTHDRNLELSNASSQYTHALMNALESDIKKLNHQAEAQEVSFFELDEFFREQSSLLTHTPSIWPVKGWVTSTFGSRRSPFTGLRESHDGLDIATRMGAPVTSPAAGVVVRAAFNRGYGNLIEIDHGYGVKTKYGHNSKLLVKLGQKIKRGDVIALVGSTGRSTGPHLHYEVLLNGAPTDPYRYILED